MTMSLVSAGANGKIPGRFLDLLAMHMRRLQTDDSVTVAIEIRGRDIRRFQLIAVGEDALELKDGDETVVVPLHAIDTLRFPK
ncbi:MAG: hypothetical protein ACTHJR_06415 [Sphingomonas sp.]|uniref:hypothetical protein n=1 Tax=Sphingomonas sp. TaxID=28214 RepID=UPI003F8116A5